MSGDIVRIRPCTNGGEFFFARQFKGRVIARLPLCAEHVCICAGSLLPLMLKEGSSFSVIPIAGGIFPCSAGRLEEDALRVRT